MSDTPTTTQQHQQNEITTHVDKNSKTILNSIQQATAPQLETLSKQQHTPTNTPILTENNNNNNINDSLSNNNTNSEIHKTFNKTKTIVFTKITNTPNNPETHETAMNTFVTELIKIITKWTNHQMIEGLVMINDKVTTDIQQYKLPQNWMYPMRNIGRKMHVLQVFFKVLTTKSVHDLRLDQQDYLKEKRIQMIPKFTKLEHTAKIGFILGPNVQFANLHWYDHMITKAAKCDKGDIEVRKEYVYEQNKRSKCITVYSIISKRQIVEEYLLRTPIANCKSLKYVSFKHTSTEEKLKALHINDFKSDTPNFDMLYDTEMSTTVTYRGKKGTLRDMILHIEKDGHKIFNEVEQGIGNNKKNTFLLYHYSNKKNVQTWIHEALNIEFIIDNNQDIKSTVNIQNHEKEYDIDLSEFIADNMNQQNNNEKQKSYAEAARSINNSITSDLSNSTNTKSSISTSQSTKNKSIINEESDNMKLMISTFTSMQKTFINSIKELADLDDNSSVSTKCKKILKKFKSKEYRKLQKQMDNCLNNSVVHDPMDESSDEDDIDTQHQSNTSRSYRKNKPNDQQQKRPEYEQYINISMQNYQQNRYSKENK